MIARADHVEATRAVGDDAREHVEPPGRAFGVGGRDDLGWQREAFQQRHDVDAIGLQHSAVGQIDLVQLQFVDALGHRCARSGQETRAHAIGDVAEPEVEASRLDLAFDKGIGRQDQACVRHRRDHAVGQDPLASSGSVNDTAWFLGIAHCSPFSNPENTGFLPVIRWPP